MQYVSVEEYLMGRAKQEELSDELKANMNMLIPRANDLLEKFGGYRKVNSGYRRQADNDATSNAAKKSKHLICAAVDLEDADGKLKAFCMSNLNILKDLGLWMEAGASTPSWCHLQCIPPKSGNRVFLP